MKLTSRTLFLLMMFLCCLGSVKANPLQQDTIRDVSYQLYPLGVACRDNDMATIKRLLAGKDEPMAMGNDFYEFDIFYTAIYFDKEDVLKYALTRYKDINNRLYSDEYGLTLLTYACKLSNVKLARILLEHGIDVNGYQSPYDTYKVYPIREAIANNNVELVQLLLKYHADVHIKDNDGNTPLDLARKTGSKEIERQLLSIEYDQTTNAAEVQDTLCIETEKTESCMIYRLCLNQHNKKNVVFELKTVDDSSIDFVQSYIYRGVRKFDCFAVYDNVADGNRFLFFDYASQTTYLTPACFSGFYPICSSVDFVKAEVLLRNENFCLRQPIDTLHIGKNAVYVPFDCKNQIIKAPLVSKDIVPND